MVSREIVHCLNILGIAKKEQQVAIFTVEI